LIYFYILSTLEYENGKINQYGTAPNFQGGILSLCTCKHWMRTFSNFINEDDLWIAGLTGKNLIKKDGENFLYFLMKVGKKYNSHYDAWYDLPDNIRNIKCASKNKFGDLFKPKENIKDKFDPNSYFEPLSDHSHNKLNGSGELMWHKDIKKIYQKPYVLLFGDPKYNFIWHKPIIKYKNESLSQGQRKLKLKEFFQKLWN